MSGHNEDELIPYPDSMTMHQGRDAVGLRHTGTDVWIIPLRPRPRGPVEEEGGAMNHREQARADLREWGRTVLKPAMREDIARLEEEGLTTAEATCFVVEQLRWALRGLHGFPVEPPRKPA